MGLSMEELEFDNAFIRGLPGDTDDRNIPRMVEKAMYSRVPPRRASAPSLVAISSRAAALLDLDPRELLSNPTTPQILSGNHLPKGMDPFAMAYGGHQFGVWAGQLGDGRAINLGEVLTPKGQRWMLQLKGAGPTPYSRTADGLAVLRSSIREFLCSEAMYHLGIPTTRALSLVLTGDLVERDMFYNGHPKMEPGAVVCRLSPSFTRFGSFQLPASRGDTALLKNLLDHTLTMDSPFSPPQYQDWFRDLCEKTLDLVIHWMRVGFVHGVLNTDNMSTS
ncbi:MAG: protein adenylyltransferase SelO family protein, partial [Desulfovibrionales bacterium]|nr:protein adenylyltransferase SelO family protein [Desulfovibrionales bacterium]